MMFQLFSTTARVAILSCLFLGLSVSAGQEKKAGAGSAVLPDKVASTLKARFPKAVIAKQTREHENGRVIYDIEFTQNGKKFEADIFEDGVIHNWERAVGANELPGKVRNTLEKNYPKAALREIMVITEVKMGREVLDGYEIVLALPGKKELEVTIAPDGVIREDSADEKEP